MISNIFFSSWNEERFIFFTDLIDFSSYIAINTAMYVQDATSRISIKAISKKRKINSFSFSEMKQEIIQNGCHYICLTYRKNLHILHYQLWIRKRVEGGLCRRKFGTINRNNNNKKQKMKKIASQYLKFTIIWINDLYSIRSILHWIKENIWNYFAFMSFPMMNIIQKQKKNSSSFYFSLDKWTVFKLFDQFLVCHSTLLKRNLIPSL